MKQTAFPTVTAYREAVRDSYRMMRTLNKLAPLTDKDGLPRFIAGRKAVLFEVKYGDADHVLKCFLEEGHRAEARQACLWADRHALPGIVPGRYLEKELAVAGADGNCRYYDVVLTPAVPDSLHLGDFIRESLYLGQPEALSEVAGETAALLAELLGRNLLLEGLRWENLRVTGRNRVVLTQIDNLHPLTAERSEERTGRLLRTWGALVLWLEGLARDPGLPERLELRPDPRPEELAERTGELTAAAGSLPDKSKRLAEALFNQDYGAVHACLEAYRDKNGPAADAVRETLRSGRKRRRSEPKPAPGKEFYEFINDFHEGLAAVRRLSDDRYGFIDASRKEKIPCRYDWVSDFEEGLAIVRADGKHGVVDREGRTVVPLLYDDLEWFAAHSVISVSRKGEKGLLDRRGKALTPLKYRWIGSFTDGRINVQGEDGKMGCLDALGREVIPCIYDEIRFEGKEIYGYLAGRRLRIDP